MKKLVIILGLCAITMGMTAQAQDTTSFTWKGSTNGKSFSVWVVPQKSFTIDWGDGFITNAIGNGYMQFMNYMYKDTNNYTVNLIVKDSIYRLNCPDAQISSIDVGKKMTILCCPNNQITFLDIKALGALECQNNQLSNLDLNNTALVRISCYNNQLSLSELYAISQKISSQNPYHTNKELGTQILPAQQAVVGYAVDLSSEATLGGKKTNFKVEKDRINGATAIIDIDYTIDSGIIVFNNAGIYVISMYNSAITSDFNYPAYVYAEFNVREANTDATLASLAVSKGKLTPIFNSDTLDYTVDVKYEIKEMLITATTTDTNAVISGDTGLWELIIGENVLTITVTAEDKITTQEYFVKVNRADTIPDSTSIAEITQEQLIINDIEIFDMLGRKYVTRHCGLDPQSLVMDEILKQVQNDVPHLELGIYIVKIYTDKGIIIRKIVK